METNQKCKLGKTGAANITETGNWSINDKEGLWGLGLQQVNYGGLIDWPLVCSKWQVQIL